MAIGKIPEAAVPDPVTQRRRQKLFLIVGALGVLGVIGALVSMQDRGETRRMNREEVKTNFAASNKRLSDREVWVAKSEQDLQKMREDGAELKRDIEGLRRQLDISQGRQRPGDAGLALPPPPPPPPPLVSPAASRDSLVVPPGGLPPPAPGAGKAIRQGFDDLVDLDLSDKRGRRGQRVDYNPGMVAPGVAQPAMALPESEIFRIEITLPQDNTVLAQDTKRKRGREEDDKPQRHETYIPAGAFVRGILLAGVDAPASNQAQSNPHPVLIRVKDLATLPNRFRTDVRECFITAAAYGDISSERAYIRTETLSCVQKDGQVLEARLNGYVSGEDGKTGMRGRLVTKEGQLLARALLAGALSGIGKGLSESYKTTSVSALGTTTTTDPNKIVESGVATGASSAMDRLSKYYIDMAEKTFPIIEIDANREVEVVFTRGVTLEGTLKNARMRNQR